MVERRNEPPMSVPVGDLVGKVVLNTRTRVAKASTEASELGIDRVVVEGGKAIVEGWASPGCRIRFDVEEEGFSSCGFSRMPHLRPPWPCLLYWAVGLKSMLWTPRATSFFV